MRSRNAANSAALTASVWLLTSVAERLLSRLATLSVTSLPARISPPLFETDAAVTSIAPPAVIWPAVPSAWRTIVRSTVGRGTFSRVLFGPKACPLEPMYQWSS